MEFLNTNIFQTTSSVVVSSSTETVENLLRRDQTFQYITSGFNNDLTTAAITFTFTSAELVSRVSIIGHNLKSFRIFYNGLTANTLALASSADTTTADYSSNSETSNYFSFTAVTMSSLTIDMRSTISTNAEKAIGYVHISDVYLDFDRIPTAGDYNPNYSPMEVVQKMADGGTRINRLSKKFEANIKFKFISESFRDSLFSVWDAGDQFVFVPFGTTTGWDGILHEVVWPGKFNFFEFSDNALNSGFSGQIKLMEV